MTNDKSNEKKNTKARQPKDVHRTLAVQEAKQKFGCTESYVYLILRKAEVTEGRAEEIRRWTNDRIRFYKDSSSSVINERNT